MPQTQQSATLAQLLDAVTTLVTVASGLDPIYIAEWYDETMPPYAGDATIAFRPVADDPPQVYAGAGRSGKPDWVLIAVGVYTRKLSDSAYTMKISGRLNFALQLQCLDVLQGFNLFSAYQDGTTTPATGATCLTIAPCQMVPNGPRAGSPYRGEKGYLLSTMYIRVHAVLPLTVSCT